jgi:hypothetical protein
LVLLALLPPLMLAGTPLPLLWSCLLTPLWLWYYWQWYNQIHYLRCSSTLTLGNTGQLYWFNTGVVAGQLCRGGLVSQYAIKLRWQRLADNGYCQRWVFSDQCADAEFRALARAVTQQNWSLTGSGRG